MEDHIRKVRLSGFLKWIGFDRDKIVKGRLENRIKVQKLVYFGKKFGLPLDYDFDFYLYGPYSSELADDYYHIPNEDWEEGSLKVDRGIELPLRKLMRSDALYLEIAATLDSIMTKNKGVSDNKLIEVVANIKHDRLEEKGKNEDYLKLVLKDIKKFNNN
jgi:uncharacterized protein YwgA